MGPIQAVRVHQPLDELAGHRRQTVRRHRDNVAHREVEGRRQNAPPHRRTPRATPPTDFHVGGAGGEAYGTVTHRSTVDRVGSAGPAAGRHPRSMKGTSNSPTCESSHSCHRRVRAMARHVCHVEVAYAATWLVATFTRAAQRAVPGVEVVSDRSNLIDGFDRRVGVSRSRYRLPA